MLTRSRAHVNAPRFQPKVKVEIMVENEEVQEVIDAILGTLRTGHLGDGQVAILSVEAVMRVRTGVHSADTVNQRNGLLQGARKIYRPHNESDGLRIS
jgi:nitrogen regulatory protein PII